MQLCTAKIMAFRIVLHGHEYERTNFRSTLSFKALKKIVAYPKVEIGVFILVFLPHKSLYRDREVSYSYEG